MDMNRIRIVRSDRRTIAMQIKPDGSVTIRAPHIATDEDIRKFALAHEDWMEKNLARIQGVMDKARADSLTAADIAELAERAKDYIPGRVAHFAPIVGVSYGRITIRSQKTRWGSCSAKGNLNFNCLLMLVPPEVLDYVVVHELCHRKEMNHSARFWSMVAKVLPDYKSRLRWLKRNGGEIIARMQ